MLSFKMHLYILFFISHPKIIFLFVYYYTNLNIQIQTIMFYSPKNLIVVCLPRYNEVKIIVEVL